MITRWPVEHGLGAVAGDLAPGELTLELDLGPDHLDASGQPVMAVLACLADCAIGVSVFSSFEAPMGGSTLEMRIDRAAPLGPGARSLRIEGRLGHQTRSGGLGRAVFIDDTGAEVAHGMATMAIVGLPPGGGAWSDIGPSRRHAASFDARALETSPAWDGPDPSLVTVPVDGSMANPRDQVHGGVLMTIAERAQRRLHPPGASLLTMTIEYLRPITTDAGRVTCASTVIRRGRRYSTVRTELLRPDGKVAAEATGIAGVAEQPAG